MFSLEGYLEFVKEYIEDVKNTRNYCDFISAIYSSI